MILSDENTTNRLQLLPIVLPLFVQTDDVVDESTPDDGSWKAQEQKIREGERRLSRLQEEVSINQLRPQAGKA